MKRVSGTPRWLGAAVGVLLLGILGMHALGLHGVPDSVVPDATNTSHPATTATVGHVDQHAAGNDSGKEHGMHEMAGLCLALLIAGVLFLAGFTLRRIRHSRASVIDRGAASSLLGFFRPTPLDHRPPYVWAFSVIRC